MNQARFRFYAELNDFLHSDRGTFSYAFQGQPILRDTIESLGVPHTEIDLILVNGNSVDFTYLLQDRDFVSVYPMFESIDIQPILRVRPQPLRKTRFIVDVNLGRLAQYLRLVGFDTWYRNDDDGAFLSQSQRRILLTRDMGLLKRREVTHGYCLRETYPQSQLIEVLRRFDLFRAMAPLQRCLRCNGLVHLTDKQKLCGQVPTHIWRVHEEFYRCDNCGKIYWKGALYMFIVRVVNMAIVEPF